MKRLPDFVKGFVPEKIQPAYLYTRKVCPYCGSRLIKNKENYRTRLCCRKSRSERDYFIEEVVTDKYVEPLSKWVSHKER